MISAKDLAAGKFLYDLYNTYVKGKLDDSEDGEEYDDEPEDEEPGKRCRWVCD